MDCMDHASCRDCLRRSKLEAAETRRGLMGTRFTIHLAYHLQRFFQEMPGSGSLASTSSAFSHCHGRHIMVAVFSVRFHMVLCGFTWFRESCFLQMRFEKLAGVPSSSGCRPTSPAPSATVVRCSLASSRPEMQSCCFGSGLATSWSRGLAVSWWYA